MRHLLDTQIAIAVLENRVTALMPYVQQALAASGNELHVSVVSLWEIAIKWRLGKLGIRVSLEELPDLAGSMGLRLLVIEASHVLVEADPEPSTRDPFDRLLLAQCAMENLTFVTQDRALRYHPLALQAPSRALN